MNAISINKFSIACGCGCWITSLYYAPPALAAPPVIDHYISSGDNHFVASFLAVDSQASIDAAFDLMRDLYGTRRIYWRGLQESLYIDGPARVENVVINKNIEHARHLIEDLNINQVAVQAARARGMEIWGVGAIYDWGVDAKDPIFYGFSGDHEHWLRVNNPEWIPVDKYGVRRQGGAIELAYADARQAIVDWHVNEVINAGYDGMISHTYHENFTLRFADEFGFSDPIVNEFKNRYGVDIRKEDFNRQDWYDLRGEYTTQFLSELHTALAANGKGLSMAINPTNVDIPHQWLQEPFPVIGNITMDWRAWSQNGYVDELMVWGASDIALNQIKSQTQGTGTDTSLLTSDVYFPPLAPILNSGTPVTGAYSTDEDYLLRSNIPVQPLSSLASADIYERMRVLAQIVVGDTAATAADVTPLVDHPNLIMRRLALKALGKIGDPASVPVLEQALLDPESGIRNAAIVALAQVNRPQSAQVILNAIDQYESSSLMEGAIIVLRSMGSAQSVLEQAATHANPNVRSMAVRALAQGPSVSASLLPIFTAALNDSESYVRAFAVDGLARVTNNPAAVSALVSATSSLDPIVSNRAATGLAQMLRSADPNALSRRTEVLDALETLFRKFGDAGTRADDGWGYVQVGQSLYNAPPFGLIRLDALMDQRSDRKLSERAWEILYLQQVPGRWAMVTEAQDSYAHFKRPRWDTVVGLADSFDAMASGSQIHNQKAQVGQTWLVTQGNPGDQIIQSTINNGGNALQTVRRHGGVHELRLAGDARDAVAAEISLVRAKGDWLRPSSSDFTAFGIDIGAGIEAQILIDPNSYYRVWQTDGTANGGSYLHTNFQAGIGGWETIEIVLTWDAAIGTTLTGSYDVFLSRDASSSLGALERTLIAAGVPIHSLAERTLMQLFISNQTNGLSDVTTYWDNVSLTVGRVPEPAAGMLIVAAGAVLLRRTRRAIAGDRRYIA